MCDAFSTHSTMTKRIIVFGYQMNHGDITLHPKEAATVQKVFSLYIGGLSYNAITQQLNEDIVQYREDVTWNKHMIKRILENRCYIGEQDYPALITPNDFDAVTRRKAENPYCIPQQRKTNPEAFDYQLLPYALSAKVRRLNNEINRGLERSPDPNKVRPLIFACAAEKYAAIGVTRYG